MIGPGELQRVKVADVELDRSNPRIQKFLEMYPNPSPKQIFMALGAASDDHESDTSTSFEKLRQSVLTNGGIIQPIIVNCRADGTMVCIEGNTRVALYRRFADDGTPGNWEDIPALVYQDMDPRHVDAIRLQVHMVGTRPWTPYAKAKYLTFLRKEQKLNFSEIIDYCGGRQKEIELHINAFQDMESYYRPLVGDEGFEVRKFSGFVELQKPGIKEALIEANFTEEDFANWIDKDRMLDRLEYIRQLPRILRNEKARKVFLQEGAKKAIQMLDPPPESTPALSGATLLQLTAELDHRLYKDLGWQDVDELRKGGSELGQRLQALISTIQNVLQIRADEE